MIDNLHLARGARTLRLPLDSGPDRAGDRMLVFWIAAWVPRPGAAVCGDLSSDD
jgi:hypothetical protein